MNRPGRLLAAVVLAVALAGCASEVPPGEAVPELRQGLALVDGAVVAGDVGQAREALDELARQTVAAREGGRLTAGQADPVLAAIARLAADLPGADPQDPAPSTRDAPPRTTTAPRPTAAPDPTADAPPSQDGGPDGDGGDGDGGDGGDGDGGDATSGDGGSAGQEEPGAGDGAGATDGDSGPGSGAGEGDGDG